MIEEIIKVHSHLLESQKCEIEIIKRHIESIHKSIYELGNQLKKIQRLL